MKCIRLNNEEHAALVTAFEEYAERNDCDMNSKLLKNLRDYAGVDWFELYKEEERQKNGLASILKGIMGEEDADHVLRYIVK